MGIKICGHKVRWQKPIKLYTFLKASCLVLMIGAIATPPASAAESIPFKASTCAAVPCPLPQEDGMSAPATNNTPQHRAQRTAGTPSMSPALALAMAFGLRNVQGPVERSRHVVVRRDAPAGKKQAFLLTGEGGHKRTSMNAAGVRLALED